MAVRVVAPDGDEWVVSRRLAPGFGPESPWARFTRRFKRTASKAGDAADPASGCLDAIGDGFVVAIGIIIAAAVVILFVIPLLVAFIEVAILLLLALLSIAARIVFRRPWTVEARCNAKFILRTWRIVGWRASGARVTEIAQQLEAGVSPDAA